MRQSAAQNVRIHGAVCEAGGCFYLQMIDLCVWPPPVGAACCRCCHLLQTFMIPGSIIVNILAGSMYSLPGGWAVLGCAAGRQGGGSMDGNGGCAGLPHSRLCSLSPFAPLHVSLCTFNTPHTPAPHRPAAAAAAAAFAVAADCAGATCNYWLSRWLLRGVMAGLFPARVAAFAAEVGPCCVCGWVCSAFHPV